MDKKHILIFYILRIASMLNYIDIKLQSKLKTCKLNEKYVRTSAIMLIISTIIWFYPRYDMLTSTTVKSVAVLSTYIIGVVPAYSNNTIMYNFGGMTVSPECSGVIMMFVFLIVVWFIPNLSLITRIGGIILVPILYVTNILRLLIAVEIGNIYGATAVTVFHATIGQLFSFVILVGCFIMFLKTEHSGRVYPEVAIQE
jgi:exosortase/archaeosortase family protein